MAILIPHVDIDVRDVHDGRHHDKCHPEEVIMHNNAICLAKLWLYEFPAIHIKAALQEQRNSR